MFRKMFNVIKDPLERRPEPEAAGGRYDEPGDSGEAELFAGMDFAETILPEETAALDQTNIPSGPSETVKAEPQQPAMAEADEGLFSGLSMITDPLAEAIVPQVESTDKKGAESGSSESAKHEDSVVDLTGSPMQEGRPPQNANSESPPLSRASSLTSTQAVAGSPPPTNLGGPAMGVLKLPPASAMPASIPLTVNSVSSNPALRPAVVRKKKRSMRVGYAREGESDDISKGNLAHPPQTATPSDGTPMSQSPRSSVGDFSELQVRSKEEESSTVDNPKEPGVTDTAQQETEADALSPKGVEGGSKNDHPEERADMEEVESKGLIAMVLSSSKTTEVSEKEVEEATRAAAHIEKERKDVESEPQEVGHGSLVDSHGKSGKSETEVHVAGNGVGMLESAQPDSKLYHNANASSLPTAASIEKVSTDEGEAAAEVIAAEQGTEKGALRRLETDLDIERIALEEQLQEEEPPTVESLGGLPLPEQVAQVRQYVEKRLAIIREKVATELSAKKAAVQSKREAVERAAAAAARLAVLEQQVTDACDEEDFERADELTKEIEYVEREAAAATAAARAAEGESDSASAKVQATAQEEVAVELEGATLLRAVIASAHANALRIQQSTEAAASEQEERLQQQEDEVAERRRKVGLELRVIEEENAALRRKIDESTRGEVEEKEGLLEVKRRIEAELEELRAAVAEKERELAVQQGKVTEVEAKIAVVASKFGRELKGLQADEERVSLLAAQLEAELERVAEERRRVAATVEEATSARKGLEETAARAEKDAAQMEGQAKRKQEVAAAAVASQRRKEELAEDEKKLRDEAQATRERAASLRASFQEVTVVKLRLQQELAAEEHKVEAADKRAPELEAEKKLAAQARNFKEAARLSSEAKALATERERAVAEVGRLKEELRAAEKDEQARAAKVAELESELTSKEKEAATARCERLRLVAAAARREMDEAAEAEDFEEAGSLQIEAETADAEAEQLKGTYQLEGARFEVVEHVEDGVRGDGNEVSREDETADAEEVSKENEKADVDEVSREDGKADDPADVGVDVEGGKSKERDWAQDVGTQEDGVQGEGEADVTVDRSGGEATAKTIDEAEGHANVLAATGDGVADTNTSDAGNEPSNIVKEKD